MLSVRLPQPLESQLTALRNAQHFTKSAFVQLALEKHLSREGKPLRKTAAANPFASLRSTGNRNLTIGQIMRVTRTDNWMPP